MGLRRDLRIKRLLNKLAQASPSERGRLHGQIRDLLNEARNEEAERGRYSLYCTYSTTLGQLFLEGTDLSDALRPFGCSYLTACIGGDRLKGDRIAAAEGLVATFAMIGDYILAAECAYEVLTVAGRQTETIKITDLLVFLANAARWDEENRIIDRIYDDIRPELELARADWAAPMRAIVDTHFGLADHDYDSLVAAAGVLMDSEYGDLTWTAHRAFAMAALKEMRLQEATEHVDRALAILDVEGVPWLNAPLLGLSARIRHANGDSDGAFDLAMQGWASVLPALLWCKNDYARQAILDLATSCVDVALAVAADRRDWTLLTELVENSRLQAAVASTMEGDEGVAASFPAWLVDRFLDAIAAGAARAGIHAALAGDWRSGLRDQVVASWEGRSALSRALDGIDLAGRSFTVIDAFDSVADLLAGGALAWVAAVRNNAMFWTLSDAHGSFDGGVIELAESGLGRSLATLRELVLSDPFESASTADRDYGIPMDALVALAEEGSIDEIELMGPLTRLLPDYLVTVALQRSETEPLRVLFAMPPVISCIPWAVVPLNAPGQSVVRLVERIEVTIVTPTAVRARAPRPQQRVVNHRIVLSCCDPAADLLPWSAVRGDVTLDGRQSGTDGVPVQAFLHAVEGMDHSNDGVLFIRSHLGTDSTAGHIADKGIAFADGVLTARLLALHHDDGSPICEMPPRVVLALCSGAGSGEASGLAIGLAAACRLAGAEEVVATLFDVIDSGWSCEFDHRLAEAATQPSPLGSSLRRLQLQSLSEWRAASVTAHSRPPDDGPTPLVWAAYGVVN